MIKLLPNSKTRYCYECRGGETSEVAVEQVTYTSESGRRVRVNCCSNHAEMVLSDYEEATSILLLPRTKREAEAHVASMPDNLLEIVNGKRVGIPTLSAKDPQERAAGILCPTQVSWRN